MMHPPSQPWPWIAAALAGGLSVGWLDRSATEVQGPLLLLMTVAFLTAIPRKHQPGQSPLPQPPACRSRTHWAAR